MKPLLRLGRRLSPTSDTSSNQKTVRVRLLAQILSSSAPQMSVSLAGAPSQIAKLRGVVMELAADDGSVTLADGRQLPKNVFRQVRFCPHRCSFLAFGGAS